MTKNKIEIDLENPERHPLSEIFGDENESNLEALKESIIEMGVQNPIYVDKDGLIVDGFQRVKAIQALIDEGYIPPDYEVRLSEFPCEEVWALNIVRRHLTPAKRVQRALQVDQWGLDHLEGYKAKTQRQIADQAGTSPSTVNRVINEDKEDKEPKEKSSRKSREDELEEELIAMREERDAARSKLNEAEERISMMTEQAKTGKKANELKSFAALQKRLKAALTQVDTQKTRLADKDREIKTLKAQLKKR